MPKMLGQLCCSPVSFCCRALDKDMGWGTAGEVMRLKVGGLLWGGVPCSSWVFLNRHTSKRSREAPLGDEGQPSVRRANLLVTRWTLLVLLAVSRGCLWLAEQPMSSLMPEHPRLKQVCELGQTPSLHTHLQHNMTETNTCMFMPCCSINWFPQVAWASCPSLLWCTFGWGSTAISARRPPRCLATRVVP